MSDNSEGEDLDESQEEGGTSEESVNSSESGQ